MSKNIINVFDQDTIMAKRVKWVSDKGSVVLPDEESVKKYLEDLRKIHGEYQEIEFRRVEY